jgi:hypothetical protein
MVGLADGIYSTQESSRLAVDIKKATHKRVALVALILSQSTPYVWRPLGDSNPCCRRERV